MKHVKSLIAKEINKAGVFGLISLMFAWYDIIRAFAFAFGGDLTKTIENILWALFGVLSYYFSCWSREY